MKEAADFIPSGPNPTALDAPQSTISRRPDPRDTSEFRAAHIASIPPMILNSPPALDTARLPDAHS
ncbi:hypothetical protein HYR69_06590 [Candidatus Sumerlaeota bacterium]|nr:hypothetical protein [Candidatus Sumerlaeota bacterium]